MTKNKRKTLLAQIGLGLLFVLTLPILLFVYQPAWQLGGFGLLLGTIGYFISPIIILGFLVVYIIKLFKSK